jgi:cytochrome c
MEKIKALIKAQIKVLAPAFAIIVAIILFAVLTADLLYRPKEVVKRGFQIELSADGKAVVKAPEKPVDIASLLKAANVDNGAKIFKKCASCHTIGKGEGAKVGPNLFGVLGRKRGSMSGFAYSEAMKNKGGAWDAETISQFIAKPKDFLPGTKMGFPGLKKPQDRADVILFLEKNR